jgi:hypothetical protein
MKHQMMIKIKRTTNVKNLERRGRDLFKSISYSIVWRERREARNFSARIACLGIEIRTRDFLNTKTTQPQCSIEWITVTVGLSQSA